MSETTGESTTTTNAYAGLSAADYLRHLRADTARILDLLETAPDSWDNAVPLCPGWTTRDAVEHTGAVFAHKTLAVTTGARPVDNLWVEDPSSPSELADWFRQRRDELIAVLSAADPSDSAWTWHEDHQDVAFWLRRMAQEAVVHRVDVESGTDVVSPVDHSLAVDGIDEVLDWFLAYQAEDVGPDGPGRGTVLVRTGDQVWRVVLSADDVELVRAPGRADALITGEASELLLWLWGRRPDSAVVIEGDSDLVASMRARLAVVTE